MPTRTQRWDCGVHGTDQQDLWEDGLHHPVFSGPPTLCCCTLDNNWRQHLLGWNNTHHSAKYFELKFDCTTKCVHACCCPKTPPPGGLCDAGTAFARDDSNPLTELGCKRWGWYFEAKTSSFDADLVLGQTTVIGKVSVTIDSNGFSWVYQTNAPYGLLETHVKVLCNEIPKFDPPHDNPCAPGQYGHNSGCLHGASTSTGSAPKYPGGKYWAIFHAKISKAHGTCQGEPSCPNPDEEWVFANKFV